MEIKLNRTGVRQLLQSSEIAGELANRARRIATAAGEGHEVEVSVGRTRARAVVVTVTTEARLSEATHRTLTRAIDAGR